MASEQPFGIDFGGTGIKGAPVDLDGGDFAAERERIRTPEASRPWAGQVSPADLAMVTR